MDYRGSTEEIGEEEEVIMGLLRKKSYKIENKINQKYKKLNLNDFE
jgi:hypothetical protein